MAFCNNCGAAQPEGAKFCNECGAQIGNTFTQKETNMECPKCGGMISPKSQTCPFCGYVLPQNIYSNSVLTFANQITEIEKRNFPKESTWKTMSVRGGLTEKTEAKVELIKCFPIPNDTNELLELMKYTLSNSGYEDANIFRQTNRNQEALKIAWRDKFEQVKLKASYIMSDSPEYKQLVELKESKKRRYNTKVVLGWLALYSPIIFIILAGIIVAIIY